MRTIIIEPAPNGWIVYHRPTDYAQCAEIVLGVYSDMISMQCALPTLLDIDIPLKAPFNASPAGFTNAALAGLRSYQESLRNLREASRPDGNFKHTPPHFPYLSNEEKQALLEPASGDRTPETIGGTELTPSS